MLLNHINLNGYIFSMLAIGIYFLIRTSLNYPGYEYQTKFSEFFTRFGSAWNYAMTAKGAFFTFFPTLLLLGLIYWAFRQKAFSSKEIQYSRSIVLLPFLLFAIGAFATPGMIGRMVMHALPFYVAHISKLLEKLEPH